MKYKIALQKSDEGFSVSVPGLPGCWSQGATEEERQVLERQGLDVLDRVVGETRRRYPEIRLIGLAVMVDSADDSAYEAIFRRHGAEY